MTLPAEARRLLGVHSGDRVTVIINPLTRDVRLVRAPASFNEVFGAVHSTREPLSVEDMQRVAHEDHADHVISELRRP